MSSMSEMLHGRWYFSITHCCCRHRQPSPLLSPFTIHAINKQLSVFMCRRCKQFCLLKFESVLTNVTKCEHSILLHWKTAHDTFIPTNHMQNVRQSFLENVSVLCSCSISHVCVCVCSVFIFRLFSLSPSPIPLKHNNIFLTHSKHIIKWNACWVNKFLFASFNDTNIERTHSKLFMPFYFSFRTASFSTATITTKIQFTQFSLAFVYMHTIVSRTYVHVFPSKYGVKLNSYAE